MTLMHRRLLLASFFIIFAVCGPALVLYASGYRYNTRLRKIEQVGILSLSTHQEYTTVLVDGKAYPIRQDLLLSTLRPRDYNLVVTKDGFHPWTKRLPIAEGRTTFARNIWLFPDAEPDPIELFANPLTLLAENDQYAVYQGNTTMVIYALSDGAIKEQPFPQPEQPVLNASVTTEGMVLFQQGNTWYRCDTASQPLVIEALPTPPKTTLVQFSGKKLFALTTDAVWEWTKDGFETLFLLDQPQTVHASSQMTYVISSEATQKRSFLHEVTNPNIRPRFITTLPYSHTWEVADADGTLLTLHDAEHQRLFLVDNRVNPPAVETIEGVFDWHWSKDHRALLTASANEVAIYHVENGIAQELLVRQTDPIVDSAWGPEELWVIYATETTVMAAERDNRDVRNIITLATDKKHPHVLKVSDEHIVFSSQQGKSFVFWQFPLEAL